MRKPERHLMVDLRAVIRGKNSERRNTAALLLDAAGMQGHARLVHAPDRVTTRGTRPGKTDIDTGRVIIASNLSPREWVASVKHSVNGNRSAVHVYASARRIGPSTAWIKWPEGSIG